MSKHSRVVHEALTEILTLLQSNTHTDFNHLSYGIYLEDEQDRLAQVAIYEQELARLNQAAAAHYLSICLEAINGMTSNDLLLTTEGQAKLAEIESFIPVLRGAAR